MDVWDARSGCLHPPALNDFVEALYQFRLLEGSRPDFEPPPLEELAGRFSCLQAAPTCSIRLRDRLMSTSTQRPPPGPRLCVN